MTTGGWLRMAEKELVTHRLASARLDAQIILGHVTGKDRSWLLANNEAVLTPPQLEQLSSALKKRCRQIPIAQIVGRTEFYGMSLEVNSDVLAPRPESERIIELAIGLAPQGGRVLDVGTGSGALAIALSKQRPDLEIVGSEISAAALAIARRNSARHGLTISFVESNLLAAVSGSYDLMTANLPYVAQASSLTPGARHEPQLALMGGGADGLDIYRRFFAQLPGRLKPGGSLICESDPWQQSELAILANEAGLKTTGQDYFISVFSR